MTRVFLILLTSHLSFIASCDASESWQLGLQDPATPIMESMLFFHNYLMMFLLAIGVFVSWMLISVFYLFNDKVSFEAQKFSHDSLLETFWTIVPAIILLFISIPSFALLYSLDELINPLITLKVVGHQWYWSYEYSDYFLGNIGKARVPEGRLNFDSYMISTSDLTKGALRLLEVDNRSVLPVCTHIRLIVTAADVLHSWAVPSFGIKIDACPGRLSQGSLFIKREGVYYGQCSEICGVNHGFMPIVVRGVIADKFAIWTLIKIDELKQDYLQSHLYGPYSLCDFDASKKALNLAVLEAAKAAAAEAAEAAEGAQAEAAKAAEAALVSHRERQKILTEELLNSFNRGCTCGVKAKHAPVSTPLASPESDSTPIELDEGRGPKGVYCETLFRSLRKYNPERDGGVDNPLERLLSFFVECDDRLAALMESTEAHLETPESSTSGESAEETTEPRQ